MLLLVLSGTTAACLPACQPACLPDGRHQTLGWRSAHSSRILYVYIRSVTHNSEENKQASRNHPSDRPTDRPTVRPANRRNHPIPTLPPPKPATFISRSMMPFVRFVPTTCANSQAGPRAQELRTNSNNSGQEPRSSVNFSFSQKRLSVPSSSSKHVGPRNVLPTALGMRVVGAFMVDYFVAL